MCDGNALSCIGVGVADSDSDLCVGSMHIHTYMHTYTQVTLSGTEEQIKRARARIDEMIGAHTNAGGGRPGGGAPAGNQLKMPIPGSKVGLIIGRAGATINRLQAETHTRIQIAPDPEPDDPSTRIVTIVGDQRDCEDAQKQIYDMIKQDNDRHAQRGGGDKKDGLARL